jgi:hypothetical protein
MRWTDLPPDRDSADAGASGPTRGEWEDLRRRLERLPPGHPSRPGHEDLADEDEVGDDLTNKDRADQGRPAEGGSSGRRGVTDGDADRHGEPGGYRECDAERGAVPGRREPYRPWFTAGESPQPWFAADPGDEGTGA